MPNTYIRTSARRAQSTPEPGRGSRFEAWIPAALEGSVPSMPHGLPLGDGETVMVVETDRERLLRSEEMLAALGYEPVGFEHSEDAAAALRSNPSRFDVIVLSYSEDSPDGANLADAFHEMAPSLPLVLAAPPAADLSSRALAESGVSEVLQKPLVSAELGAAMVRSLRVASQM